MGVFPFTNVFRGQKKLNAMLNFFAFRSLGLFKDLMDMRHLIKIISSNQDWQSSPSDSFWSCRLHLLHAFSFTSPTLKKKAGWEKIKVVTDFDDLYFPFYCIFCSGDATKSWVMVWTRFLGTPVTSICNPKAQENDLVFICVFRAFQCHLSSSSNELLWSKWISNTFWCRKEPFKVSIGANISSTNFSLCFGVKLLGPSTTFSTDASDHSSSVE